MPYSDHVARMEEKRNGDTGLVGKLDERRSRRRWKETMKMVSEKEAKLSLRLIN
jgi:hypothetical protein